MPRNSKILRRIVCQTPLQGTHILGASDELAIQLLFPSRSKDEANARAGELLAALCANLDLRHFTVSRVHNPVVAP